jgi:hypothetical protein
MIAECPGNQKNVYLACLDFAPSCPHRHLGLTILRSSIALSIAPLRQNRITALFLVQLSGSHFEKETFWQKGLSNIFNVLR